MARRKRKDMTQPENLLHLVRLLADPRTPAIVAMKPCPLPHKLQRLAAELLNLNLEDDQD